jgi:hypothetical protein
MTSPKLPGALCLAALFAVPPWAGTALAEDAPFDFGFSSDGLFQRQDSAADAALEINLYPTATFRFALGGGWRGEIGFSPELYLVGTGLDDIDLDNPYVFTSFTAFGPDEVSLGLELEGTYDRDASDWVDEEWRVFGESPRLGRLTYGFTDSAIGETCITAPGETTNFVPADDLTSFGTCESFGYPGTLRYSSPDLNGYTLHASLSAPEDGDLEAGDPRRTAALAVTYAGAWGANEVEWSVGVERVNEFFGTPDHGGDSATFVQAGLALTAGDFVYRASAGLHDYAGTGADQSAVALGLDWNASDRLLLAAGVIVAQIGDYSAAPAVTGTEVTYGLAAEYSVIPDRLKLDAGVSWKDSAFGAPDDMVAGIGFNLTF